MSLKTKSMSIKKISFTIGKGPECAAIFPYLEVLGIYQIEGYVWMAVCKQNHKNKKESRTLNVEVFR